MQKKLPGFLVLLAGLLSLALSGCSLSHNAIDNHAAQRAIMLYDNDRFGGNAAVVSSEFTATDGSGSTIHIWYDNQEDTPVKVMLYQYGWLGFKTSVLEFEVAGGTAVGEDYTAIGADSGKYYICVQANDGGDITGYLRADQTY